MEYLSLFFFTLPVTPIYSQRDCKTESCLQLRDYILSATTFFSYEGGHRCPDFMLDYCNFTMSGGQTLVPKLESETRYTRENIFTKYQHWKSHSSSVIREVFYRWYSCVQAERVDETASTVKDHLIREIQRINQRVNYDKVMYLVPQINVDEAMIEGMVASMNIRVACYHKMNKDYPHVIDRMYIEYSINESLIQPSMIGSGHRLLKKMLTRFTGVLEKLLPHKSGHFITSGHLIQDAIDKIHIMRIKCGYPRAIMNDSVLHDMYSREDDLLSNAPTKIPRDEWWSLPIHPEAVWYSTGENSLCELVIASQCHDTSRLIVLSLLSHALVDVTPLFLHPKLFNEDLPEPWNWGAFYKIAQTLLDSLIGHDVRFYSSVRQQMRDKFNKSMTEYFKKSLDRETNMTLHLDLLTFKSIQTDYELMYFDFHQYISGGELFQFRVFHDMCYPKPRDESELELYRRSTGRLHSYHFIRLHQLYHVKANMVLMNCDAISFS